MNVQNPAHGVDTATWAPTPRWITRLPKLARALLWLVLMVWLMFVLTWGGLNFWIVPRIGDWRVDLERRASTALGVPVQIDAIRAERGAEGGTWLPDWLPSLAPSFELTGVRLLDGAGRTALQLPSVQVSVSVASVWRMGVEQLVVDGAVLDVRRTADGRIEVAGLDMSGPSTGNNPALDWALNQPELAIRSATVRWSDELRGEPTLALNDVTFVLRNRLLNHQLRLDATPPPEWGDRLSLLARVREPLLKLPLAVASSTPPRTEPAARSASNPTGPWSRWSGELYADLPRVNVSRLHSYVDLSPWGVDLRSGQGMLRAWGELDAGQLHGVTLDVDLKDIQTQLGPQLPVLGLTEVKGRVQAQRLPSGFELSTPDLYFQTVEGAVWPAGAVQLKHTTTPVAIGIAATTNATATARTELAADRLALAPLAALATRLPLPADLLGALTELNPAGRIDGLQAHWVRAAPNALASQTNSTQAAQAVAKEMATEVPTRYSAKGLAVGLSLAAKPNPLRSASGDHALVGRPGVQGATLEFDVDQNGGRAQLAVAQGAIDLPGVFEESRVPLDQFKASLRWALKGDSIDVWADGLELANADMQGTGSLHWSTSDARAASNGAGSAAARSRFPGVLDLTAELTRAQAVRVHRYLPLALPEARHYLREALLGGQSDRVTFRVKGDLYDLPFSRPGSQGEFRITARAQGVNFAYVPSYLQPTGTKPWPTLTGVNGEVVIERASLKLNGLTAGVQGAPTLALRDGQVQIASLDRDSVLEVKAGVSGPGSEVLGFVNNSPVFGYVGGALERAQVGGAVSGQFDLRLPLAKPDGVALQGEVKFADNDVQVTPDSPMLGATTGLLAFSDKGFAVSDAQSSLYGGPLRFGGGMQPDADGRARIVFEGTGQATAQGLQQAPLGAAARVFDHASGSAQYSVRLGFNAGVPELSISSDLQGMALALPAPLQKEANAALPLRYSSEVSQLASEASGDAPLTDRVSLRLGGEAQPLVAVVYERDVSGAQPVVRRGSVGIGLGSGEAAPLPPTGVQANLRLPTLDLDAWQRVFSNPLPRPSTPTAAPGNVRPEASTLAGSGAPIAASDELSSVASAAVSTAPRNPAAPTPPGGVENALAYLPTTVAVRTEQLTLGGRDFHQVVVGGSRTGTLWRANVSADELNGYFEYRQATPTQDEPHAHSSGSIYARLARLDLPPGVGSDVENMLQQPTSVPALDISVEDFVVSGRRLGRVDIQAENRGGAARAREWRLNKFSMTVPEAQLVASGNWAPVSSKPGAERRTALDFKLSTTDSGALLARFNQAGVVRGGQGALEGSIGWSGSPFAFNFDSLSGQLKVNNQNGQFLKVEPGAAKLLSVLSLQALPRRLVLDFRDVFSEGFSFDFVRGDARVERGVVYTNNLQMKGVNAAVLMEGQADLAREQQDLKVVVVPEINAGTASLIATAINPAIGLGTFLAQYLLREPLQNAATQQFRITGAWTDPQVKKVQRADAAFEQDPNNALAQ